MKNKASRDAKQHLLSALVSAFLLLPHLAMLPPVLAEAGSKPAGPQSEPANDAPKAPAPKPAREVKEKVIPGPLASEAVLPNGLKVVFLEDHSFPVVACLTWYRVGSRNEPEGRTGVTHLLEHLLFGTVGSFRKGDIATAIARVGGQFNGYTSDDFTTFFETLPNSKLELALKIESERMRKAVFTEKDVQEELKNIQAEFENVSADANATLTREVRSALYTTHPYHNPTMGWRSDVETITAKHVREYYDRYFWPSNCTIVISGDVKPMAVLPSIQKYFGSIPKAPVPALELQTVEPPQKSERKIAIKYPGKQEVLQVAYHGPAFDDGDTAAMVVLEKLLNASYAGRLKTKVIEPKIAASAQAYFEIKKDPGYFSITCTSPPAVPNAQQKLVEAVDALIGQLKSQTVSDAELKRARNQAELAYYSEQEGPYRAGFHLGYFDVLSRWQSAINWTEKLRAVSAADLQQVARKYLNSDNRVVAWLSGSQAPKPAPTKQTSEPAAPSAPQKSAPLKQPEHTRLTGYKVDDNALAPSRQEQFKYLLAQSSGSTNHPIVTERASMGILPATIKEIPAAVGSVPAAIKELPTAVEMVPTAIKHLPQAIEGVPKVIRELPSAVGSIPSAIKQLPAAIGGLPGAAVSAVRDLPGAIGGLPGTAGRTVREIPGAIGGIPGATFGAIKGMPSALGNLAVQVGSIPAGIARGAVAEKSAVVPARRVLKNGLSLVVYPSRLTPVVQISGAIQAGSAYDPSGKKGVSLLAAALMSQGTTERTRQQAALQQEDIGLVPGQMLRFEGGSENIQFSSRCLSRDLPLQVALIAETLKSPICGEADLTGAKQDALNQLKQWDEAPEDRARRALINAMLSSSSPLAATEPFELVRSIPQITSADMQKFFSSHVIPSATTIVLVGDIDPDKAVSMFDGYLSDWNARGAHQRVKVQANSKRIARISVPSRDRQKTIIGFGQLLSTARSSSEFASLLIADAILSSHPIVSRFNQKIAGEPVLAKSLASENLDAQVKPLANSLAWSCIVAVEPHTVPLAVQALLAELKTLAKNGISQAELTEMKRYLIGALPVRGMSTLTSAASTLLDTALHGDDGQTFMSELAGVKNANLESINKFIRTALKPDQTTLVVVGSSQAIRSVRSQVADQILRPQQSDEAAPDLESQSAESGK